MYHEGRAIVGDEQAQECVSEAPSVGRPGEQRGQCESKCKEQAPHAIGHIPGKVDSGAPAVPNLSQIATYSNTCRKYVFPSK